MEQSSSPRKDDETSMTSAAGMSWTQVWVITSGGVGALVYLTQRLEGVPQRRACIEAIAIGTAFPPASVAILIATIHFLNMLDDKDCWFWMFWWTVLWRVLGVG